MTDTLDPKLEAQIQDFITRALAEDVGDGDHSSLACIPASAQGKAKLLVKDEGVIDNDSFQEIFF